MTETPSKSQLLALRRKELELLKQRKRHEHLLPHLYIPMYAWQRRLHESTNRVNLLTAANQIGKSSALIRRAIANCTEPLRWEKMWGPGVKPKQFWYFYPDGLTLEREIDTKWIPDWLPKEQYEKDAQYGWTLHRKSNTYSSISFNAGPIIYFQTYTKSVSNVQSSSIHEVFCFPAGAWVVTPEGKRDISEIRPGDLVLSHQGFDRVYDVKSRVSRLHKLTFYDGTELVCTPEHPFFTQTGWKAAASLTETDVCYTPGAWINFLGILISYCLKESFTSDVLGTRTGEKRTIGVLLKSFYTWLCGKHFTKEKFQWVVLSTIKTLTLYIITFPILCVLLVRSIRVSIKNKNGKSAESTKEFVVDVLKHLLRALLRSRFAFVQETVVKQSSVCAKFVNLLLAPVKTVNKVSVLESVPLTKEEVVYNLSVENSHTFFVNNFLSHNCDEEMPLIFYDELMFRLTSTAGIFTSGFTPTLNQLFWKQAMEGTKILPRALKMSVSMYECLKYEDGSPSRIMTLEKIREAESKCKNDTERNRRIFGKFVTEEGRTYYAFEYDKHVVEKKDITGWMVYASVDYGSGMDTESGGRGKKTKNHPAAIVFIAVRPDYKKGVIFKAWRGDNVKTTAGDVFNKYMELKTDLSVVQACYDAGAADFGTIAQRNSVSFIKADKSRDAGEDLLNTLFKHNMLTIFDDDAETLKLAGELSHIMVGNQQGDAKKDDDLADATRYGCMMIPWDLSAVVEKDEAAVVKVARPMTEAEYQAEQIKLRRGEGRDGKEEGSQGWNELDDEFEHWNSEYGQF